MVGATGHHVNGHVNGHTRSNGIESKSATRAYKLDSPPSVEELKTLCNRSISSEEYPLATDIQKNVPIYDMAEFGDANDDEDLVIRLKDEWHHNLYQGSGAIVLKNVYRLDRYEATIDSCVDVHRKYMHGERQQKDDTEKPLEKGESLKLNMGFSKLALTAPETFVDYFSNPWLSRIAESWLGPAWRVNAQVNVVPPGGEPQQSHRDYHMGYFDPVACGQYPRTTQIASQFLTLQSAIAHSDMPMSSGPTRLLPFSQTFEEGYMAHRLEQFQKYFLDNYVALPLKKGDGLFFNPAIFHAAGANISSDIYRNAHLLQLNSAFGRPSERSNTSSLVASCWSALTKKYKQDGGLTTEVKALVTAMAEGHPFPTNPDMARPKPGLFQLETEQDLVYKGLEEHWTQDEILSALKTNKYNREDHVFEIPRWAALGQGKWCPA